MNNNRNDERNFPRLFIRPWWVVVVWHRPRVAGTIGGRDYSDYRGSSGKRRMTRTMMKSKKRGTGRAFEKWMENEKCEEEEESKENEETWRSRRNRERWPVIFLGRQDNERWWHTDEKDEEHLALAHSFSSEVYNNNSPSPPVAARAFLYPKEEEEEEDEEETRCAGLKSEKREWGPPQKSSLKQLFTIKVDIFHDFLQKEKKISIYYSGSSSTNAHFSLFLPSSHLSHPVLFNSRNVGANVNYTDRKVGRRANGVRKSLPLCYIFFLLLTSGFK